MYKLQVTPNKKYFFIFLLTFFTFFLHIYLGLSLITLAQSPKLYDVEYYSHVGMIIRTERAAHLSESHPWGACLSIYKQTDGTKGWESAYRYPSIGISAYWADYRTQLFGHIIALLPNMKFELLQRKYSSLSFKIGTGIGYYTRPFDLQTNYRQTQIGSSLNTSVLLGFTFKQQLNLYWAIRSGIELVHFSNAAFALPNAGNNLINANIGAIYTINAPHKQRKDSLKRVQKHWKMQVHWLSGWVEQEQDEDRRHYVFTANALATWQRTAKSQWQIGLEFNVNNGIKAYLNRTMRDENNLPLPQPDFRRLAILTGHELVVGKVALVKQIGIYLYKPYDGDSPNMPLYQRVGVKYYHNERFTGQFSMKVHLGTAESLEFGIGYQLFSQQKNAKNN